MENSHAFPQTGMYVMHDCLIVSIQVELYDDAIHQIQQNVLERVHQSRIRGVVLDVSMVEVMDAHIAASFSESARMLGLIGAHTVMVGIRPAVVSALMDLEAPPLDLQAAVTLEQALTMLEPYARAGDIPVNDADENSSVYGDEEKQSLDNTGETSGVSRCTAGATGYE